MGHVKKGPGYWKLNTQVITDERYKNQVREIIEKIKRLSLSFSERWELIKIKCREFTQKYCKQLKSKINTLKTNLEQQLTKLSEELDNQVEIDDEIKKDYIRIKCKLENTYKN